MTDQTTEPLALTFGAPGQTFEVDAERRTITGLAVPYGEPTFSHGARFQFAKGVLKLPEDPSRIKLLVAHDRSRAVGRATELNDTDQGLFVKFSVGRGADGDEALHKAEDGVWDGLSIGLRDGAKFEKKADTVHFSSAELGEISLTPDPAFSSARVAAVVASAPLPQEGLSTVDPVETPAPVTVTAPTVISDPASPVTAPEPAVSAELVAGPAFDYAAMARAFAEAMPAPAAPIAPVASFQVTEEPQYRFEAGMFRAGGSHEFSADIRNALYGDREAGTRALEFIQEQFAVAQTNVQSTLPLGTNRVGFVDRREYTYPLTSALSKGTLDNVAPFVFPRFNSLSGLVQDHTEGVEPTPGAITTTSQTVTPKAMSGKVEITREVIDQNSSPQVSNFIFSKMVRGYQEALEGSIVTELTAQAANITDIVIPIGANTSGSVLVNSLIGEIASLQYIRGGYTYDLLATQIDLYKALATAQDTAGRNLLPILGPTNAQGQAQRLISGLDLAGVSAVPSWALAATSPNRQNSWLIDTRVRAPVGLRAPAARLRLRRLGPGRRDEPRADRHGHRGDLGLPGRGGLRLRRRPPGHLRRLRRRELILRGSRLNPAAPAPPIPPRKARPHVRQQEQASHRQGPRALAPGPRAAPGARGPYGPLPVGRRGRGHRRERLGGRPLHGSDRDRGHQEPPGVLTHARHV